MSSSVGWAPPAPVPPAPVNCHPEPLPGAPMSDMPESYRWVFEQEARLVGEWADAGGFPATMARRRPRDTCEHGLLLAMHDSSSSSSSLSSGEDDDDDEEAVPTSASQASAEDRQQRRQQLRQQQASQVQTAQAGHVPLDAAACVEFPFGRASGIDYFCPTTGDNTAAAKKANHNGSSGGGRRKGGLDGMPCGEAYYYALRARWCAAPNAGSAAAQTVAALPPLAEDTMLDDSLILDSILEGYRGEFDPPVPLWYMIDTLIPEWEDEGLYEVVRRQEAQSQGRR